MQNQNSLCTIFDKKLSEIEYVLRQSGIVISVKIEIIGWIIANQAPKQSS